MQYKNHAWSGPLPVLVATPRDALLGYLKTFIPDAGHSQIRAWEGELEVLTKEGAQLLEFHPPARNHSTVLEYELPREGGRRPDVLVLQNGRVVVLEFKETGQLRRSDVDQVAAYARDLRDYHSACEDVDVIPVLVLCGANAPDRMVDAVHVVPAASLGTRLIRLSRESTVRGPDLVRFLGGEYAPLPTLVAAARLLFENLPLPHIKRAQSAGVSDAVELILEETRTAARSGARRLILLTGVPGAGKTLVGLQVAHSAALEQGFQFSARRRRGAPATFLSGNGPLIQVLQHALRSTAFVQDMHRFIREYGLARPNLVPSERLIVFDEAQRAWDRDKIVDYYRKRLPDVPDATFASEPELLTRIAGRMSDGAVVLALVGQGQEIHAGEEAGMVQWADALAGASQPWTVLGPPALERLFRDHHLDFSADPLLDLDSGLRYHGAADLHRWVEALLDQGNPRTARPIAQRLRQSGFPIYVTRDLDGAMAYAHRRFRGEPLRRYGLIASSKSERHLANYGLDTGFQATKRIRIGEWFNAEPSDPRSCCQFNDVITEFQCQGLELDMAIVCWSDDLWWSGDRWVNQANRRQRLVRDPHRLRTNAYRVLLTRGREGIVIFVPLEPADRMDRTYEALKSAGASEAREFVPFGEVGIARLN